MLLFPVRQHLIVNRRLDLQDLGGYPGDRARLQADYMNPMRLVSGPEEERGADTGSADRPTAPNFVSGGRYAFELLRTDDGWRIQGVTVHEKWRDLSGPLAAG